MTEQPCYAFHSCCSLLTGEIFDSLAFQGVLNQASQVRSKSQQWAHTLSVAGLLLQQLPSARLHTTGAGLFQCIDDLWPQLILPGLGHAVAAVRSVGSNNNNNDDKNNNNNNNNNSAFRLMMVR